MKYWILILCLSLFVASCKQDIKTVNIKNQFELSLPNFMNEFDLANETGEIIPELEASYSNPGKRFITIVSSESRNVIELLTGDYENPFAAYLDLKQVNDDAMFTQLSQNNLKELKIDGNIAVQCKQTISILGERLYSHHTIIMTDQNIYQITSLCPPAMKDLYQTKMKAIGLSFTEL